MEMEETGRPTEEGQHRTRLSRWIAGPLALAAALVVGMIAAHAAAGPSASPSPSGSTTHNCPFHSGSSASTTT